MQKTLSMVEDRETTYFSLKGPVQKTSRTISSKRELQKGREIQFAFQTWVICSFQCIEPK